MVRVLPDDVDAHLLTSELARVCESCLVPVTSLPSNRKDINVRSQWVKVQSWWMCLFAWFKVVILLISSGDKLNSVVLDVLEP